MQYLYLEFCQTNLFSSGLQEMCWAVITKRTFKAHLLVCRKPNRYDHKNKNPKYNCWVTYEPQTDIQRNQVFEDAV